MALVFNVTKNSPMFRVIGTPPTDPNTGLPLNYNLALENASTGRYWTNVAEQYFVCGLRNIEQYYRDSPVDKVAVRITDFETQDICNAVWMPFAGIIPPEDDDRGDILYVIIDAVVFFGDVGVLGLRNGGGTQLLAARLGRKEDMSIQVYITAGAVTIDDLTGNGSGSPGLRIPSTP
jgi:hypothetical protein